MMGSYPRQAFIYGIGVTDDDDAFDSDLDLYYFCKENGLGYACGGRGDYTGIVIGFELDSHKVAKNGYVGGYWVSPFDKEYFDQWLVDARAKMTPELVAVIQAYLKVKSKPQLWTISSFG